MKRLIIALALIPNAAFAQSAFVPYTITEAEHKELLTFLGDQPLKVAGPIAGFLEKKERDAQAEAAKKVAEKK